MIKTAFAALAFCVALVAGPAVQAEPVMTRLESAHDVDTTLARLTSAIEGAGARVFVTIPHHEGAASAGMDLPSTTLVVFGNPKLGAPLMQIDRRVGIALPMKMLVWQEGDQVFVGFHDPRRLKARYNLDTEAAQKTLKTMHDAMTRFATAAAGE